MYKIHLIFLFLLTTMIASGQDQLLESAKKKIQANDFAGAKTDLTKIIDGAPKNKQALNLRGEARKGLEDFYGAIGDLTFAIETDSTFADAWNNRGEAKMSLGDDDDAIQDFDKAIKFNPKLTE